HLGVLVRGAERAREIVAHGDVVGVQYLWAIERHQRHRTALLVAQGRERPHAGHTRSPAASVSRTRVAATSSGGARSGSGATTTRSAGPPGASEPRASAPSANPAPVVKRRSAAAAPRRSAAPSALPLALRRARAAAMPTHGLGGTTGASEAPASATPARARLPAR